MRPIPLDAPVLPTTQSKCHFEPAPGTALARSDIPSGRTTATTQALRADPASSPRTPRAHPLRRPQQSAMTAQSQQRNLFPLTQAQTASLCAGGGGARMRRSGTPSGTPHSGKSAAALSLASDVLNGGPRQERSPTPDSPTGVRARRKIGPIPPTILHTSYAGHCFT